MNTTNSVQLPVDFDGVFRFTNWTDRDFKAKWNNIEYTFPALKTSPMIIMGASPEQTQHIRKKFAKELAEQEFYRSEKLRNIERNTPILNSIHQAPTYSEGELKEYAQKCLEPLPVAQTVITPLAPKTVHLNDTDPSVVLESKSSLVGNGTVIG